MEIFGQVFEIIKLRFLDNIEAIDTVASIYNLLLGVVIGSVVSISLYRGAQREGSFYIFKKSEAVIVILSMVLVMLFLVPVFPLGTEKAELLGFLSMEVCFAICLITSVMDEKSGGFLLIYLLVGIFVNLLLFIKAAFIGEVVFSLWYIGPMAMCVLINILFGLFAYSMGDAGLFCMGMLSFMICMDESLWVIASLVSFLVASLTFVVRRLFRAVRSFKDKGKVERMPFTVHVYLGILFAFFLFG